MKFNTLLEIFAAFLFLIGQALLVAAATQVNDALALAVAGAFVVFNGLLVAYVASVLDREPKSRSERQ